MKLTTELERVQARLDKTEKKDVEVPLIKAPAKGAIKVEMIREHLGLLDATGDTKWSDICVSPLHFPVAVAYYSNSWASVGRVRCDDTCLALTSTGICLSRGRNLRDCVWLITP